MEDQQSSGINSLGVGQKSNGLNSLRRGQQLRGQQSKGLTLQESQHSGGTLAVPGSTLWGQQSGMNQQFRGSIAWGRSTVHEDQQSGG